MWHATHLHTASDLRQPILTDMSSRTYHTCTKRTHHICAKAALNGVGETKHTHVQGTKKMGIEQRKAWASTETQKDLTKEHSLAADCSKPHAIGAGQRWRQKVNRTSTTPIYLVPIYRMFSYIPTVGRTTVQTSGTTLASRVQDPRPHGGLYPLDKPFDDTYAKSIVDTAVSKEVSATLNTDNSSTCLHKLTSSPSPSPLRCRPRLAS